MSKKNKKEHRKSIALIKNELDILRINTIKRINSNVDFKISLLGNNFILQFRDMGGRVKYQTDWNDEISYHCCQKDSSPIIHLKDTQIEQKPCYNFDRVCGLNIAGEFPIPFMKITLSNDIKIPFGFRY